MEPMSTVRRARDSQAVCTQVPRTKSAPTLKNTTRMMASTPALAMMPESTAEAGAGAAGWASGSQPCRGYMPALAPKPTTPRKITTRSRVSCPAARCAVRLPPGTKSRVPA